MSKLKKQLLWGLAIFSTMCTQNALAQVQGAEAHAATPPTILRIQPYTFMVNGKPAHGYRITQANGTWGYTGEKGQMFNVMVKNETNVPTTLHSPYIGMA